jgi:RND superfamily putative drug exporter
VLLIAFGSVVAAGLPLVIALFGLGISSGGLIVLLANVIDVPDWTTAVSGLIGIGVGVDYALLVLTSSGRRWTTARTRTTRWSRR